MRSGGEAVCGRCSGLICRQFPRVVDHERNALQTRFVGVESSILIRIVKSEAGQGGPVGLQAEFGVTEVAFGQRQQDGSFRREAESLRQQALVQRHKLLAGLHFREKGAAFLVGLLFQQIAHKQQFDVRQPRFIGVALTVAVCVQEDEGVNVGHAFSAAFFDSQQQLDRIRDQLAPAAIVCGDFRGVIVAPGFRAADDGRLIAQRGVFARLQIADFPCQAAFAGRLRIKCRRVAVQHGRAGRVAQDRRQIVENADVSRHA